MTETEDQRGHIPQYRHLKGRGGGDTNTNTNLYSRDINVNSSNKKLDKVSWTLGKELSKEEVWMDIKPEEPEEPVTREEALNWANKKADSEIFIERNCSTLKTEDQIHRIAMIKEYIKENLK